jgi:hypothetical protein
LRDSGFSDEPELIGRSPAVHYCFRLNRQKQEEQLPKEKTMKNAIIGMTMAMALAGVSLFAQTSSAPATSSSSSSAKSTASKKAGAKKHTKSGAKSTAKTAAATTTK